MLKVPFCSIFPLLLLLAPGLHLIAIIILLPSPCAVLLVSFFLVVGPAGSLICLLAPLAPFRHASLPPFPFGSLLLRNPDPKVTSNALRQQVMNREARRLEKEIKEVI